MYIVCVIEYTLQKPSLYLRYTYSMTYSSGFVIIIPDKLTISVVSWHQMDTRLTRFVLDTRLVLETWLIFETRLLLEQMTNTPGL